MWLLILRTHGKLYPQPSHCQLCPPASPLQTYTGVSTGPAAWATPTTSLPLPSASICCLVLSPHSRMWGLGQYLPCVICSVEDKWSHLNHVLADLSLKEHRAHTGMFWIIDLIIEFLSKYESTWTAILFREKHCLVWNVSVQPAFKC